MGVGSIPASHTSQGCSWGVTWAGEWSPAAEKDQTLLCRGKLRRRNCLSQCQQLPNCPAPITTHLAGLCWTWLHPREGDVLFAGSMHVLRQHNIPWLRGNPPGGDPSRSKSHEATAVVNLKVQGEIKLLHWWHSLPRTKSCTGRLQIPSMSPDHCE